MKLPASLAFWAGPLAIFPRDVALSLGPLLRRLAPALGPFHRPLHAGQGDVDGFDGLARRGSYERLVMTEWLLADEVPEEFSRRAAMGEHTFLRVARPETVGSRASVALFDAGPSQLGSPRVLHLALLVVLARRAAAAGAAFAWATLQDPEASLFNEVTPPTVSRLLAARTSHEATDADLRRWLHRIGHPKSVDDVWVIGGRRFVTRALVRSVSSVEVEDVLEPARRQVAALVRHHGKQTAQVLLDLPEPGATVRLLRDPFTQAAAPAASVSPRHRRVSNVVFSASGFRLLARGPGGGIVEYLVPSSPRRDVGGARLTPVPTQGTLVAAGRLGKRLVAVSAAGRRFEVHWHPPLAAHAAVFDMPPGYTPPSRESRLEACHVLSSDAGGWELAFLDGRGTLFRMSRREGPSVVGSVEIVGTNVRALSPTSDGILFLERGRPSPRVMRLRGMADPEEALVVTQGATFLGFGGRLAEPEWGLVAVEDDSKSFRMRQRHGTSRIQIPAGVHPVGVAPHARRREPGLLVLDADRRSLIHVGQSWTRRLPQEPSQIESVTMSPTAADVAYTTADGDLVVYSLDHEAVLQRYRAGGLPVVVHQSRHVDRKPV